MGICAINAAIELIQVNQEPAGGAAAAADLPLSLRRGKMVQYRRMIDGPNRMPGHE